MFKVVEHYLRLCGSAFPKYGEEDAQALEAKAGLFAEIFEANGLTGEQVIHGFRHHLSTGKKFPVPADIIDALRPVTLYRMDYGPLGFDALYHPSHPYVRQQTKLGVDISRYAVESCAADALKAKQQAENAPPIEYHSNEDEDYFSLREKADAKRLTWEH